MTLKTFLKNQDKLSQLILTKTGVNISDIDKKDHFFKKEFERIQSYFKDNFEKYWDSLIYLNYFLCQFEKIASNNKKDFRNYLKKLSKDDVNLKGEKFEILTYTRLLDKSIKFKRPKNNPDFETIISNNSVFIECGTRQAKKKGYFIESVEEVINNKQANGEKQGYANLNTALHIEISKTVYNSLGENDFLDINVLEKLLDKKIKQVTFGALVLITTFYSKEDGKVYGNPVIRYNNNFNNNLKTLHEIMFNLELKQITRILKPHI